jgi:hypothetical protein
MEILFVAGNYDPVKGYSGQTRSDFLSHASRSSWRKKKSRRIGHLEFSLIKQERDLNVTFAFAHSKFNNCSSFYRIKIRKDIKICGRPLPRYPKARWFSMAGWMI